MQRLINLSLLSPMDGVGMCYAPVWGRLTNSARRRKVDGKASNTMLEDT